MGIYRQHFHCVELVSEKSEISSHPTRWGAEPGKLYFVICWEA